jgi:hypothetical protein
MQQGGTAAGEKHWLERWTLEVLRFLGDFWLLLVFGFILGFIFIWVPQSKEVWRHYILTPAPPLPQAGWALLHAFFVVTGFLFCGLVFARYAQHKKRLREDANRRPWVVPAAGFLPFVVALLGLWCAAGEYLSVLNVQAEMFLALLIAGVLILLVLATILILARTRGAERLANWVGDPQMSRLTLVCALLLLALFLVAPLLPAGAFIWTALAVGAVPAMLFSIGLVLYAIDQAFRATGNRKILAVGALGIAVLGIVFGDLASAHRVRRIGNAVGKNEVPQVGHEFLRWLEARKDLDRYEHYPVFIIAAQGGGIYAAHHTARVLAVLQDECPAFAQHVFAISGVSGGSLGAAIFASAVDSLAPEQTLEPCRTPGNSRRFVEYADRFLKRDFLSPLGFLAVIPNITQRIAGLPATVIGLTPGSHRLVRGMQDYSIWAAYDRALGLEYGFEDAWRSAGSPSGKTRNFFTRPSTSTWTGKDAVPALVLNTTRADTGVSYLVAPFRVDSYKELDFRGKVLAVEAPGRDVRISTAVTLSARYPFATGPGMIRVRGRQWLDDWRKDSKFETIGLVDGGFVENSGLTTVGKLVRELHDVVAEEGKRKVAIHIVTIQDLSALIYTHSGMDKSGAVLPERMADLAPVTDFDQPVKYGFAELTAPLLALDASRVARSFYTLNTLVESTTTLECAQGLAQRGLCPASGTSRSGEIVRISGVASMFFGLTASNHPLPLGWHLSSLSQRRIEKRTWVGTDERWNCFKRQEVKDLQGDALEELRAFGEDVGGFVDRWVYDCGKIHIRDVLKRR